MWPEAEDRPQDLTSLDPGSPATFVFGAMFDHIVGEGPPQAISRVQNLGIDSL